MALIGERVLAVIPSRKGSKGIPRKNLVDLGGFPLIAWTIRAALGATCIDEVIVSSNDLDVIKVSTALGCSAPFVRNDCLSNDSAAGVDVVIDAVQRCPGFDTVIYLQPTSPFRTSSHIDAAMNLMKESKASQCVSVVKHDKPASWLKTIDTDGRLRAYLDLDAPATRQMSKNVYLPNGAIYISDVQTLLEKKTLFADDTLAYTMDTRSSLDIDNEDELNYARFLISSGLVELR